MKGPRSGGSSHSWSRACGRIQESGREYVRGAPLVRVCVNSLLVLLSNAGMGSIQGGGEEFYSFIFFIRKISNRNTIDEVISEKVGGRAKREKKKWRLIFDGDRIRKIKRMDNPYVTFLDLFPSRRSSDRDF